jgi:hypothetical protein
MEVSQPQPLYTQKKIGDWVSHTSALDSCGEEKISCPCHETNPGPTARRYTDYAIPNPLSIDINICTLKMTKIQARSWCTWWSSWLRQCATNHKVVGSISDGVTGIFH